MPFFGVPIRNGLPIGLGSVAGFGVQQFDPSQLFAGGTVAGAWYDPSDLSTMFDSSAGTTPVAMPGLGAAVSVGLMLDKSQGLVLGSELAGSILGSTSGWTFVGAASVTGGALVFNTAPNATVYAQYNPILSLNKWYQITITITGSGRVLLQAGSAGSVSEQFQAPGTYTMRLRAAGGTPTVLTIQSAVSSVNNFVGSVTAISVRELPGNHAIAFNDTTARPELRARVNLLTYSEDFSNAAWAATSVTVTQNSTVAPDGTTTADTITHASATGELLQTNSTGAITVICSFYAKYSNVQWIRPVCGQTGNLAAVWFDIQNGIVGGTLVTGTTTVVGTPTITSAGNGWYRCSMTIALGGIGSNFVQLNTADANNSSTRAIGSFFVWGADLRPANIGANVPAYQRIADANTYDTSGFPLYLRFDGIDDSMYTPANLNLSGTDKVAVFAGVRKTTAPTSEISVEFGAVGTLNGSFYNYWTALKAYFASVGTAFAQAETPALSYPISLAQTSIGNISQPLAALRINGTQYNSTASQGTGNYGNHPLYIGSRGNSSLWFNGQVYGLLVVGSAVSAGNISATEQWVAGKTGIVI